MTSTKIDPFVIVISNDSRLWKLVVSPPYVSANLRSYSPHSTPVVSIVRIANTPSARTGGPQRGSTPVCTAQFCS